MINLLNTPLKISILTYLFTFIIFYIIKPKIMFTKDKKLRQFGTCRNKTILPIWLVSAIIGILTYNISALVKNFLAPLYKKLTQDNLSSIQTFKKSIGEIKLDVEC